jgi:hypothetical protein
MSQVADGGTACNMEGSCEYIEKTVADSRHWAVLQLAWRLGEVLTTPHAKTYYVTKRVSITIDRN